MGNSRFGGAVALHPVWCCTLLAVPLAAVQLALVLLVHALSLSGGLFLVALQACSFWPLLVIPCVVAVIALVRARSGRDKRVVWLLPAIATVVALFATSLPAGGTQAIYGGACALGTNPAEVVMVLCAIAALWSLLGVGAGLVLSRFSFSGGWLGKPAAVGTTLMAMALVAGAALFMLWLKRPPDQMPQILVLPRGAKVLTNACQHQELDASLQTGEPVWYYARFRAPGTPKEVADAVISGFKQRFKYDPAPPGETAALTAQDLKDRLKLPYVGPLFLTGKDPAGGLVFRSMPLFWQGREVRVFVFPDGDGSLVEYADWFSTGWPEMDFHPGKPAPSAVDRPGS